MSDRIAITEQSRPRLTRGVRLHYDNVRESWVLLAPERVFVLDEIAHEIVRRCDGEATVGGIAGDLALSYAAPVQVVFEDVCEMLQGFAEKRILDA